MPDSRLELFLLECLFVLREQLSFNHDIPLTLLEDSDWALLNLSCNESFTESRLLNI